MKMKPKSKLVQMQLDVLELKKVCKIVGKEYPVKLNILKLIRKDLTYFRKIFLNTPLKLKTNRQCTNF